MNLTVFTFIFKAFSSFGRSFYLIPASFFASLSTSGRFPKINPSLKFDISLLMIVEFS